MTWASSALERIMLVQIEFMILYVNLILLGLFRLYEISFFTWKIVALRFNCLMYLNFSIALLLRFLWFWRFSWAQLCYLDCSSILDLQYGFLFLFFRWFLFVLRIGSVGTALNLWHFVQSFTHNSAILLRGLSLSYVVHSACCFVRVCWASLVN